MQTPDLSRFNEDYRRAQQPQGAAAAVQQQPMTRFVAPDGPYRVMVESVELTTAKTSGNPLLKWRLRITSGPFENRLLFKNRAITSNTIDWVKKELELCGLELEPFSSLPLRLRDLANLELAVSKVSKGEHDNVYVNKRLSPGPAKEPDQRPATSKSTDSYDEINDDIPF